MSAVHTAGGWSSLEHRSSRTSVALVRRASTHTHMHTWSPLTHTHTRTQVHAYTQARMHTPTHTCTVRVRPICNTSYIYAHTKNYISALKCRSQEQLQLYILRLLVNVCQWYDSDVILLRPVHECVVICRKRRTQQTVTARACQKNAGAVDSLHGYVLAHLLPPVLL